MIILPVAVLFLLHTLVVSAIPLPGLNTGGTINEPARNSHKAIARALQLHHGIIGNGNRLYTEMGNLKIRALDEALKLAKGQHPVVFVAQGEIPINLWIDTDPYKDAVQAIVTKYTAYLHYRRKLCTHRDTLQEAGMEGEAKEAQTLLNKLHVCHGWALDHPHDPDYQAQYDAWTSGDIVLKDLERGLLEANTYANEINRIHKTISHGTSQGSSSSNSAIHIE